VTPDPGSEQRWEVERDRFGHMVHPPLEVGDCVEMVPASQVRDLEARVLSYLNEKRDEYLKRTRELEASLSAAREALEKIEDEARRDIQERGILSSKLFRTIARDCLSRLGDGE
jgi:predicted phage-related endonuclease